MSRTSTNTQGIISLLFGTFAVGLSGLFAKFLPISAWMIVQGRTALAFAVLLIFLIVFRKRFFFNESSEWLWLFLNGVLLSAHWVTFFLAIQVSTVAIGLLSFSAYPLFTTFLEPLFFRESLQGKNVMAALIVIAGLTLMASSRHDPSLLDQQQVLEGVLWGLASGLGFAILTILNRKHVRSHSPLLLTCWQNGFAALILIPWSWNLDWNLSQQEWGLLLILGIICTAGGHALLINGLRHVRAQLASLMLAGLEPVYAIVFAIFLLDEVPSIQTILGGLLIVGTTIYMIPQKD